ncbi:hypothetical protein BKA70DRAFT_179835 [Coprinopsis sp. MPI-PUGE-AT-0042]|nr:hypothetical protein BKA70DRAFT_179835 [Coprinopsis sp. MPI-PUGE-AT-0042]
MAVEARAADAHCFAVTAQEDDLNLHIDQEIARSHDLQCLLKKAGSPLRDEIVSLVKTKCGGMFLHASLQLDALCRCINAREVRQTLDAFPSRIEDVYVQTWHRILEQKTNHVMFAKAALVWILNASRPMMIEELEHAVATSPDTYKFEPDRLVPGTTLVSLCRGLVTLEEESGLVRLVHNTAKDALQGLLHESFPLPHSLLATICMTHIADSGFQNTTLHSEEEFIAALHADPLLAYASDCWATHARVSLHDEDTRRRIVKFVRESKALPTFTGPGLSGYFDVLRPAHILAIHNLPLSLVTLGNTDGQNIATKILKASPLLLASWHGHFDLVQNLLLLPANDGQLHQQGRVLSLDAGSDGGPRERSKTPPCTP